MIPLDVFVGLRLQGGFVIAQIEIGHEPMMDALGREAVAQTSINGHRFSIRLGEGLDSRESSITLYHEILEAATVACANPPARLMDFNEGDFEHAAQAMQRKLGQASPATLNRMLQLYGF